MKKLTAYVCGKVQEVGYRGRVVDMAKALGLKGMIENLSDGRVKIIAEGDDEKLKWFEGAIDIKNALIYVSSIDKEYSPASGEFDDFGKLVIKGETDTRLDAAAAYLKDLISAVNNMNENLGGKMDRMDENLSGKIDQMNENLSGKIDQMNENLSGKIDQMNENLGGKIDQMNENLGGKMDRMLDKQDELLVEVKDIGQKQDEFLVEVKDVNRKFDKVLDRDIAELKGDMAEVKAALRAKGII